MSALTMNPLIMPRHAARRRTATQPGVVERAFAAVVLFLSTGALLPLLRPEGGPTVDEFEGDPVAQITWLVVYGITLVLLATRAKETLQLLGRERWLLLLCGLVAASIMWSVAPGVTFRRTAALFGTTAFGVYLASRYRVHELMWLVRWVLSAAAVLSAVFVVVVPVDGISDDGAWRGIFAHKNFLGHIMALTIVVLLFELRNRGMVDRIATAAIFVGSCMALLESRSVAGLLVAVVVVVTMPLWPIFRLRRALAVAAAVFALLAIAATALWLIASPEQATAALGKDSTLTGRTALWSLVLDAIAYRPWLGYGYNAFWLGRDGESAAIWAAAFWQPSEAHNGYLDLGLQLGVVGVILFLSGFAAAVWRAIGVIRRTSTAYALWPMAYLMLIVIANLAESMILVRNNIFWILYVVTCVWLIRPHPDKKAIAT